MEFEASFDLDRIDRDLVFGWLRGSYWAEGIRRDIFEASLSGSIVLGIFDSNGRQVGFARVISDRATFAWVCDVIVDPDCRGNGIGKLLMQTLGTHPDLQTLRRWALATKDAQTLYNQFGFGPVAADRWMHRPMPPELWKDPEFLS